MDEVLDVFGNYCLNTCVSSASPRLRFLDKTKTHCMKDMIWHTDKKP